jgi:regulator of Ty1 transposition protein 103
MSFSESSLQEKFQELNSTQQSVQTLSLWLIHHRKHSRTIVNTWLKELLNANKSDRKLTFMYLANDILQNSRKKGNEYGKEFATVLEEAIDNTSKFSDEKVRFTIERILNIWKDRRIYPDEAIEKYKRIIHSKNASPSSQPKAVKNKLVNEDATNNNNGDNKKRKANSPEENANNNTHNNKGGDSQPSKSENKSVKVSLRDEVLKEMSQNNSSLPVSADPGELVNMLQDLEKSASSDAVVRKKIAELPPKVTDLNELKKIKDKSEAMELAKTVNEAIMLLENYNSRLQQELVARKRTAIMLATYLKQQQNEIDTDQKLVDEWHKKFKQVLGVRKELETHLKSLPDLSSIEVAAELVPLPSAGDLFN